MRVSHKKSAGRHSGRQLPREDGRRTNKDMCRRCYPCRFTCPKGGKWANWNTMGWCSCPSVPRPHCRPTAIGKGTWRHKAKAGGGSITERKRLPAPGRRYGSISACDCYHRWRWLSVSVSVSILIPQSSLRWDFATRARHSTARYAVVGVEFFRLFHSAPEGRGG